MPFWTVFSTPTVQHGVCCRKGIVCFRFQRATLCWSFCLKEHRNYGSIWLVDQTIFNGFCLINLHFSRSSDSRRLADRQLKSTCEVFIDFCGDFLIGPVRVYLAKVSINIQLSFNLHQSAWLNWLSDKFFLTFIYYLFFDFFKFSFL